MGNYIPYFRGESNKSMTKTFKEVKMVVSACSISAVENGTNRITYEFAKKFKRAVGITDVVLIDIQYLQTIIAE